MIELAHGYKPVVIGHEVLDPGFEDRLQVARIAGVAILTDSVELQEQASLAALFAEGGRDDAPPIATLRYCTQGQLPMTGRNGRPLRRKDTVHPGEIYAGPDLNDYYYQGPVKFGSMASRAYGIRAYHGIEAGRLGLHSSLLVDRETGGSTLVVAKSGAGKSSIGMAIEKTCQDKRFILLSDDWNEVDVDTGDITPVSALLSPNQPNDTLIPVFTSYGKTLYRRKLSAVKSVPKPVLERVIELSDGSETGDPEAFMLRSLSHIPFINQPIDETLFACRCLHTSALIDDIAVRIGAVKDGYQKITSDYETIAITNDRTKDSLAESVAKVLKIMEQPCQ